MVFAGGSGPVRAAFQVLLPLLLLQDGAAQTPAAGGPRAEVLLRDPRALLEWLSFHNGELAAVASRVDQSHAEWASSRLFPNPAADFTLGDVAVGQTNPPGLSFSDTSVYSTGISTLIELGKRGPRIESARLREEAARQGYRGALAQKAAEARRAVGRVVYLKAKQASLEEGLDSARKVVGLERTRLEHGDLSRNDFDRLLLDTTTLELDISRNRAELEGSMADARSVLFAPLDAGGARIEDLEAAAPLPAQLGAAEEAIERRPDLQALRLTEESARQDMTLARRKAIPDITFRVGYIHDNLTISGDQPDTLSFGIAIPLPFFDRGQHDAARALSRALEMSHLARAAEVEARSGVEELRARRSFLEAALDRLQREAIPRSAEVLDTTLKAQNRGQVSMTDLILARRTHLGLLLSAMDLRFEYFNVRNELRRVLGLDAELEPPTTPEEHR